jgi:lysine 2,3-aminomutase
MPDPKHSKTSKKRRKTVSTRVSEDSFVDAREMRVARFSVQAERLLETIWDASPELHDILRTAPNLEDARDGVYSYLEKLDRWVFDLHNSLHVLENAIVRDSVRVFRSIIGPINEKRTKVSALDCLWKLASERRSELQWSISVGFLTEILHLFQAISGSSGIYELGKGAERSIPEFLQLSGREAATKRTEQLDIMADKMEERLKRFPSGLNKTIQEKRKKNKTRILHKLGASQEQWNDYRWHLENVFKTAEPICELIEMSRDREQAVHKAVEAKLGIGISPYYMSLIDPERHSGLDHALRAQVIPYSAYVESMIDQADERKTAFDFMGEQDTSPEELITRRYPRICILKPYNTCAQICVYCQRNWEIDECMAPDSRAPRRVLDKALKWISKHPSIGEVLVTGGDPAVLPDEHIEYLLENLSKMDHIYRIRLGTRTPVVLPMRWTKSLTSLLGKYHRPGKREICVVTHFAHSYEITPEAMKAVQRIRRQGIGVYNQQVYTLENSRRFETVKLRRDLRRIGVDPYYTFNMKGKDETSRLMVPIARILQERKEEARLLPGLDRTDEPVFNVPRLGKNHLRAFQDHRLVMIRPDGSRIYEFHPWEKNLVPMPPYNYTDVPIYNYLEELAARGEDIREYQTIWYYY